MALGARLELRQGQGLVITPQLQQAIKLLQLSNMELDAYVEGELERNPLLQRDERESDSERDEAPRDSEDFAPEQLTDHAAAADLDVSHDQASPGEHATGDAQEAQHAGGAIDWSKAGKGGGGFEDTDDFESRLTREKTLSEHLHDQLSVVGLSTSQGVIAAVLIDSVDEGGYLRCDLAETADRLGCELAVIEEVLTCLQGFEPTGVFARDVRECLMLQLKERDRCDPAMVALLDNLDHYMLDAKISSPEDAALSELNFIAGDNDVERLQRYVNLPAYGRDLLERDNAVITPYGHMARDDFRPILAPFEEPTLDGMEML